MGMPATIPRYTVDDLEHFPRDGNRYELLDGMLLVTPAPGVGHEVVISRLVAILVPAVQAPGHAYVFTHGAVRFPPGTQLEPDMLVVPTSSASAAEWQDVSRARGVSETVRDVLLWREPTLDLEVRVDLAELFADLA